jgi:DNA-binding NarL/FixJ family response regulator
LATRILIVDDHGIVREGLAIRIELEPGMKVVGFACNGNEAVASTRRLNPDVIIMDLVLPNMNGIDATRMILADFPQTHIIALSSSKTVGHVRQAIAAGARGYVLKTAVGAELIQAVNTAISGRRYISPAIAASLNGGSPASTGTNSPLERLSAREREVLRRVVAGATSAEIAKQLSLSQKTVETYRSRLMGKLGVSDRASMFRLVLEYELPLA